MKHGRKISVVGLGYVGLPVAVAMARLGETVIAFDINLDRIAELRKGFDNTNEVPAADLAQDSLVFTSDPEDLKRADFHIVAVPTPITETRQPDLRPICAASRTLGGILKSGDIVVYESTVYPGVSEEVCAPLLAACSGLTQGQDFFIGYSPERINPGDREHRLESIVKVVAGENPEITEILEKVYGSVVTAGIHRAPSIKVAEAAKVIENTQRDLNIALMNELAMIFERLDIDTSDVLAAAGTKWNFRKFTPGLVGGHCIGVDPYYLTHRAEQVGLNPQIILAGRRINDGMGAWIAGEAVKRLLRAGVRETKTITILGITFKEDIPDVRNTKVIDIIEELQSFGFLVQVHDSRAAASDVLAATGIELAALEDLKPAQAVVLAVPHKEYLQRGWPLITSLLLDKKGLVVDVRAQLSRRERPDGVDLWRL